MKKLILTAGILCAWLSSQAQDSTKIRKLKFEEANLVGSYYTQNGNMAAVTGGIGSEKLTDIGSSLNLTFSLLDKKLRKNTFFVEGAIEQYTSASSDQIGPTTLSSASRTDQHIYPSIVWTRKNDQNGQTLGLNASYSTEFDYKSYGFGFQWAKATPDNNGEFSAKVNVFLDKWKMILPAELRPPGYPTGAEEDSKGIPYKPRNTYNASLGYSRIINPQLQGMILFDPSYQEGLLSTPFHRVYFNDNSLRVEKLPGSRIKFPISLRTNYFAGDNLIFRTLYRYYLDTWGLQAHTLNLETVWKINPFFSLTPHYRFNAQNGIRYYAPYQAHDPLGEYYSSDTDLSKFTSHFGGLGMRVSTPGGILGINSWKSMEIRYGIYHRSTALTAHIVSLAIQIK